MLLPAEWLEFIVTNSRILTALTLIAFPIALICVGRELFNSRTSQGAVAWILSLLLLPFPTVLFYLAFGWKQFDDYASLQTHTGRDRRAERARELLIVDEAATEDWKVLARVAQMPFLAGNSAELLIDGTATFESLFEGIDRARHYILVEFFTIRDDRLGQELADHLIERARAGVSVRVLYDDVGSRGLSKAYLDRLRAAGVQVAAFNQQHQWLRLYGPMRINYRNHRKIVVVDGVEAWVGGHNVAVDYLGENAEFGHWRDTHVHLRGPAALACALVFREDWAWATGEQLPATLPDEVEHEGKEPVLAMPTGPADKLEDCAIAFTEAMSRAKRRLWIVSPYFVPGPDIQTAFYAAVLRGVDVRILLPRKADHRLVWLASYAHADDMVAHGVKIYRYNSGFLHEKVILVDDEIAGVGTVNFDNRSFRINFEITLWFTGPDFISKVASMLETDFAASTLTTSAELSGRPLYFRLAAQIAKLFSPLL